MTKIINHHHPPRSTITTTQACSACRYQRRKCAPDCILAPYFPHDRQRQFQNAHKLFGVSNITKIIRDLDPPLKDEAMRTIIYQSDVRAHDPVGGCYRIIRELQRQIEFSCTELEVVLHQLAFCRTHAQNQILIDAGDINNPEDMNLYDDDQGVDLDLGQMTQQQEMNSWGLKDESCEEFKPLLIPAGERQEFKFEFDDINEPSEEALFNDGNDKALTKEDNVTFFTKEENVSSSYQQHSEDNDLKSAATLFTLTNCSTY